MHAERGDGKDVRVEALVGAGERRQRGIGIWLLVVAVMVAGMVVLGGLTRLTESGLSMVDWRPITGWLPPLTHESWEAAFRAYQAYPEYQKVNAGMSLEEFQGIFWLEYVHRLWGRLIGVVFAVPLVVLLIRRRVDRPLGWKLAGLFVLGGLQGALGWYMVKSGLVDRPDVSQYRLVAHLGFALLIYGCLLWVAFGLLLRRAAPAPSAAEASLAGAALGGRAKAVAALIFLTILSGGFVAGLDAGYAYNTFPLMDGELIPTHLFAVQPWWRSAFEDVTTVQFVHRLLAMVTLAAVLSFRLSLRRRSLAPRARVAVDLLAGWVMVQVGLGIATLLTIVALPLAALHQFSALILLTLALWVAWELSGPAGKTRLAMGAAPGRSAASGGVAA